MLRWAVATGRIAENPLRALRVLRTGRAFQVRPRRALTEIEVERFLRAVYAADVAAADYTAAILTISSGVRGPEYAARPRRERVPQGPLLRFLIESGARWSEARQIAWADLDAERCRVTLRPATTKNRRGRVLPLKPSMVEELQGLLATHHAVLGRAPTRDGLVFLTPRGRAWREDTGNVRRMLTPIWKVAGIPKRDEQGESVDIHSLRHTAATRLARAGWPMALLQKFMGHADARTTMGYYDHLAVDDLQAAFGALPEVSRVAGAR
jgi:integrase